MIRLHLAHAVWNRHNEAGLYQRDSTLCIVQFGFVFLWPACGNLPFSRPVVTPLEAGPRWHALPPHGLCGPSRWADQLCLGASFLCLLGPVACLCLAQPGACSCPSCRLSDLLFQPRMQADKCRTSSRSVKKDLVIESPLQRKDAAQGEMEAESPGPVLVRRGCAQHICCLLHEVLLLCVCL